MRDEAMPFYRSTRNQKGMALFVSLIFLLLLTVVGMASMKNASLQEKMAGNSRFKNISFQMAEAALREAEHYVGNPDNSATLSACAVCTGANCQPPDHTAAAPAGGVCANWTRSSDGTSL